MNSNRVYRKLILLIGILVGSAILQAGVCVYLLVAAPPSFGDETVNLLGDTYTKLRQTPLGNEETLDCPNCLARACFSRRELCPAR